MDSRSHVPLNADLYAASKIPQPTFQLGAESQISSKPAEPEINPALLCRGGVEFVQEILTRINEIFASLKSIQPPNGSVHYASVATEKKARLDEQLRNVTNLIKRLRLIYNKCCELTKNLDGGYTDIETLIPLVEDNDTRMDEKYQSEVYRQAVAERTSLREQVTLVNKEIKSALDIERTTIFKINCMLSMRRT